MGWVELVMRVGWRRCPSSLGYYATSKGADLRRAGEGRPPRSVARYGVSVNVSLVVLCTAALEYGHGSVRSVRHNAS
ncbi:hypothetical protein GCM10009838_18290 [Catenulispora subtropica]|uniref:Uncharacterized protein n=1 Tax=Catenulispora subtropica TaxID=450798 RepID=A0ABN2R1M7_9ACTN